MVYLREIINNWKKELLSEDSIHSYCYYYIANRKYLDKLSILNDGDENILASSGYKGIKVDLSEVKKIIGKYNPKRINFTNNIFRLLGIYLTNEIEVENFLKTKYISSPIRTKYLIACFIPEYKKKLIKEVRVIDTSEDDYAFSNVLKYIYLDEKSLLKHSITTLMKSDCPDVIDIILFEELENKLIHDEICETKYINKSELDIILQVLENFSNAIKRITINRRKDHPIFKINDEYDVQDLLYVMLKSIFPDLKIEEPTPQVAGKHNRIDLCIPTNNNVVFVEVKMIKEKDNNEKEFIRQLKEDIQSYYKYEKLSDLIFFIYDPQNKTTDRTLFSDLDGEKMINGITFNVRTVLSF